MRREAVLCYTDLSHTSPLTSLMYCSLVFIFVFQRDAVSTSRGSQPNTLEYAMAMEWCLHRARSDHAFQMAIKVLVS